MTDNHCKLSYIYTIFTITYEIYEYMHSVDS